MSTAIDSAGAVRQRDAEQPRHAADGRRVAEDRADAGKAQVERA